MKLLPNILIVDDNLINLHYLEVLTSKMEINLVKALSGEEALEITQGMVLALAILDVMMPGMNGYELAQKLNQERSGEKVPIIFITAKHVNDEDEYKGYNSGAVDYIFKPVNSKVLLGKIEVFINLFEQKQTIARQVELLEKSAEKLIKNNDVLRKREEKLKREQQFSSALLQSIPGIFYLYTYPEMRLVTWNKQHESTFGYEASEMKNKHVLEWHHPETHEAVMKSFEALNETGKVTIEAMLMTKDRRAIPFILNALKFERDGRFYLIGVGIDITERKAIEEELNSSLEQLHKLTQYINQVRENERIAISRDLHDDLGQALTAVKIDLGFIRQNVDSPETATRISKVSNLVGDTIKTVQRITSQLRPDIIEDLGLVAAIDWHSNEFSQRTGIKVFCDMDISIELPPEPSLIIYRIVQESLTNIARHSKATTVEIKLARNEENVILWIGDNGIGITDLQRTAKNSFGLISMKERADSMGGTFSIGNNTNRGTVITLSIPFKN